MSKGKKKKMKIISVLEAVEFTFGFFFVSVFIFIVGIVIGYVIFALLLRTPGPYGVIGTITISVVVLVSFWILLYVLATRRAHPPLDSSEDKNFFICPQCNIKVEKDPGICPKCGKNLSYSSNIIAE